MPTLVLLDESGTRTRVEVTRTVMVGRALRCEILIEHPRISRYHARLVREPDGWYIEDLDSVNGVIINDRLVRRAPLHDHDIVTLGCHESFEFLDEPVVPPDDGTGGGPENAWTGAWKPASN